MPLASYPDVFWDFRTCLYCDSCYRSVVRPSVCHTRAPC